MAGKQEHRYSVYERGTDRPICIYATSEQCAKALGIPVHTFYTYVTRQRSGRKAPKKLEIFIDDFDDEEESDS